MNIFEYVQRQIGGFILGVMMAILLSVGLITAGGGVGSDESPIKPFEPGSGFNVAAYCKAAKTVTILNTPGAEVVGVRRVASNTDLDYILWLDNNANTSATRYYVDKQGQPQHELVDVEGATTCLRQQR